MKKNENVVIKNNNIMRVRGRPWVSSKIEFDLIIGLYHAYDDGKNPISLENKNIKI